MTIHSAADHGFTHDSAIRVTPGLEFRHRSAEALYDMKVLRAHRDAGYWECVFLNGPRKRAIWVRSESDILTDAYRT